MKALQERFPGQTHESGREMGFSLQQWRELVRWAWLMGLLERKMKLAVGEKMGSQVVMNTYETTAKQSFPH